jgi:hypothetical protein
MANPATRVAPGDVTAPPIPGAPVVVPYGRGLQVSVVGYTTVDDFFRFRYFKNGSLWRETPQPSQIDYDVAYGSTYQYTVAAIDTALPSNVSAQSGIGSGVPAPIDTPDIKTTAVSDVSYQILTSVNQLRNATQAAVAVTGLSVSRNFVGSNYAMINFSGIWQVGNNSGVVVSAGVSANLIRDGVTTVSGTVQSGVLTTSPGPGNVIQITLTIPIVDAPGAGTHIYTITWNVVSTNVSTLVEATCQKVLLEVVELKR